MEGYFVQDPIPLKTKHMDENSWFELPWFTCLSITLLLAFFIQIFFAKSLYSYLARTKLIATHLILEREIRGCIVCARRFWPGDTYLQVSVCSLKVSARIV